ARPWIVSANFPFDRVSRFVPIDSARFAIQFRRVSCESLVLWNSGRVLSGKQAQRFKQRVRRNLAKPIVQRTSRVSWQDVDLPLSAALIGGAVIFCSRPTGLSGCVTTATKSCSDFLIARNVGTPISPVPIKTIRICGLSQRLNGNALTISTVDRFGRHFLAGG